ncbi:MAG: ClpX C4-type zinc finger protein [Bryobacteraceae bacterium]
MGDRSASKELRCSFCGKAQESCQKLISSPNGIRLGFLRRHYHREYHIVSICDQCVARCVAAVIGLPAPTGNHPESAARCSFCHHRPEVEKLVPAPGDPPTALICEMCLAVCNSILEDDLEPDDQDRARS